MVTPFYAIAGLYPRLQVGRFCDIYVAVSATEIT